MIRQSFNSYTDLIKRVTSLEPLNYLIFKYILFTVILVDLFQKICNYEVSYHLFRYEALSSFTPPWLWSLHGLFQNDYVMCFFISIHVFLILNFVLNHDKKIYTILLIVLQISHSNINFLIKTQFDTMVTTFLFFSLFVMNSGEFIYVGKCFWIKIKQKRKQSLIGAFLIIQICFVMFISQVHKDHGVWFVESEGLGILFNNYQIVTFNIFGQYRSLGQLLSYLLCFLERVIPFLGILFLILPEKIKYLRYILSLYLGFLSFLYLCTNHYQLIGLLYLSVCLLVYPRNIVKIKVFKEYLNDEKTHLLKVLLGLSLFVIILNWNLYKSKSFIFSNDLLSLSRVTNLNVKWGQLFYLPQNKIKSFTIEQVGEVRPVIPVENYHHNRFWYHTLFENGLPFEVVSEYLRYVCSKHDFKKDSEIKIKFMEKLISIDNKLSHPLKVAEYKYRCDN